MKRAGVLEHDIDVNIRLVLLALSSAMIAAIQLNAIRLEGVDPGKRRRRLTFVLRVVLVIGCAVISFSILSRLAR